MKIDFGLAVVILAVLVFYLRLIILQRQRVKRLASSHETTKKGKPKEPASPDYSIFSRRGSDRIIGMLGIAAMVAGALLYAGLPTWEPGNTYWWIPAAGGVVAFSWMFRL